jgi:tRNA U55 pseudouridine synthase TruB
LFSDIAKRLGTVSTTPVIIRTKSGMFKIEDAITLDEFDAEKDVLSIEEIFKDFETIEITDKELIKKLVNGVKLKRNEINIDEKDIFFIKIENQLLGMYHFDEEKLICDVFLFD